MTDLKQAAMPPLPDFPDISARPDLMRQFHAHLRAYASDALQAEQPAWQPIETAPRDATLLLLYGEVAGEISGIAKEPSFDIGSYCGPGGDYGGFDWISLCGDAYAVWLKPTHWHPIPAAPKEEA